ncbi:putative transcriptional regulator, GntR family protein [Rhodococcoides trifolii]|uniref:Transcriptional regulator, GntR family protein n=1 Tax=Rhodococcoides trifolii TaxID=908250 RepID=A0A917G345_9NOCA|nr:GntR family transcriptional regulator [Rhodococcus trifolii]GGG20452.1 putative transcriptional regulator, GntR family protein [Rhodococcus trifolii]
MRNLPTSADRAYSTVKELIVSGDLPGGELISEGEIAERTGTSRTPVREAFLRLQSEGWMRLYPKRGALVVPIADGEAGHLLDARQLVETGSLQAFAEDRAARVRATEEMRASLERQRALAGTGDFLGFSAEDADFHATVVRHGRNPLLDVFYASLRDRQRRMTAKSVTRDPGQLASIIADHEHLAALVADGRVDEYDAAVRTHMYRVHGMEEGNR